jgi:uncharacterized protein YjbI with pentapeptide repeats
MHGRERAFVRPRAVSPLSGEPLLLADLVGDLLDSHQRRPIQIVGGAGSGKTTALRHLAELFAHRGILCLDQPNTKEEVILAAEQGQVLFTTVAVLPETNDWSTLRLAPWEEDDVIEYARLAYPAHCGAIISRLRESGDSARLEGSPELWTLTLDYLGAHGVALSALDALRAAIGAKLGDQLRAAQGLCFTVVTKDVSHVKAVSHWEAALEKSLSEGAPKLPRFFWHVLPCQMLAADAVAQDLADGAECHYLEKRLPRAVVELIAGRIKSKDKVQLHLRKLFVSKAPDRRPMAASIMQQVDRQWLGRLLPHERREPLLLTEAYLDHADWPGIKLEGAHLSLADLSAANLAGAVLAKATARRTNFHGADLTAADLRGLAAEQADFSRADLRDVKAVGGGFGRAVFAQANLGGSTFHRANLESADLSGASLVKAAVTDATLFGVTLTQTDCTQTDFRGSFFHSADFRMAKFDGVIFHSCRLRGCNFEETRAADANFCKAHLTGALLTGSVLTRANFAKATLRAAGLAEIDWEGADLRGADLRGASFHLGSSRSGLVGSPIAREGSMTGFYTDDFTEQDFKSPEEIRKANLRAADLRGANIEGVDFYLVDLRDARYDAEQVEQLRASGAILHCRGDEG